MPRPGRVREHADADLPGTADRHTHTGSLRLYGLSAPVERAGVRPRWNARSRLGQPLPARVPSPGWDLTMPTAHGSIPPVRAAMRTAEQGGGAASYRTDSGSAERAWRQLPCPALAAGPSQRYDAGQGWQPLASDSASPHVCAAGPENSPAAEAVCPARRTMELIVITTVVLMHPVVALAKTTGHAETLATSPEGSVAHGTCRIVSVIS